MNSKSLAAAVILSAFSMQAQAFEFTVNNKTNSPVTFGTISNDCSTTGGSGLVFPPDSSRTMPPYFLKVMCLNKVDCQIDVYMSNNCGRTKGSKAFRVVLNINKGINYARAYDESGNNPYTISTDTYSITILPRA